MTTPYTHPPPPPHMPSQPFTTILLPPPTLADTLSIHEYRPPPLKDADAKRQGNSGTSHLSNTRSHANSHSASPPNPHTSRSTPPHHVNPSTPLPPSQQPYGNVSAAPAVPATFASIMNAYPPQPSGREELHTQSRPGSREEPGRRKVRE